jgi:hypothetical protein
MGGGFRFLILNTDYPEFLNWLYAQHPGLEQQPYDEQMEVRNGTLFSTADFYSSNLRKLGHEAYDIHADNEFMQKAWANEQGIKADEVTSLQRQQYRVLQKVIGLAGRTPLRHLGPLLHPVLRLLNADQKWFYSILAAQIKHYEPDVLLNLNMHRISTKFLREMKPYFRLLLGEHAATRLSEMEDLSCYDLVISSFPPTIEYLRQRGIRAELNRLGFEPSVLSHLKGSDRTLGVSFIGSFYSVHSSREALLNVVCARFPETRIWGPNIDHLPSASPIRKCYQGQAWGRQMFQILSESKITLNHHGDVAPYANNMRLFEATGMGTLLITDWKLNLTEMFEPGREVVTYHTFEECAERIVYYLEHEKERDEIAKAGQQRTLREHTYYHRVQELVDLVRKYQ